MKKNKVSVFAFFLFCTISFSCKDSNEVESVRPRNHENSRRRVENKVRTNIDNDKILDLVNDVRSKGCNCTDKETNKVDKMPKVPALEWNETLAASARDHANDMEAKAYFSHNSPMGVTFGQRLKEKGYVFASAAENIAQGQKTEEAVVEFWLQSSGHCKNIMSASVKEMGVARSDGDGFYWTQLFGAQ